MEKNSIVAFVCAWLWGVTAIGQHQVIIDSIPFEGSYKVYEMNLHIPVGQTFLVKSQDNAYTFLRQVRPDNHIVPDIVMDTMNGRHVTNFTCRSGAIQQEVQEATFASSEVSSENKKAVCRYTFSHTPAISEPDRYIWEVEPAKDMPVDFKLNTGYGSARLDLSGLSMHKVDVFTAAADVVVSYEEPNKVEMASMSITGGVSRLHLRNLEMANAREVKIENGMGRTRLVLGGQHKIPTNYHILVGAGKCTILAHEDIPVRLVLSDTFLSTVEVPACYTETSKNVFVNHHYKAQPEKAVTFFIDIGLGNLSFITINK